MALIGEMRYLQIGGNTYEIPTSELPIASSSTLGGIKVGTNLSIDSSTGVLSVTGIPTKINDITTYDNFGIGYIDCNSSDRIIFVSNVKFGTSGSSDYSSPFLLMFQKGSARYGTVTISGSGSFHFYDINTNRLLSYQTSVNYTNLQYGKLYIAYMSDNTLTIKSVAETTDIPTIPTNISAFTNDAGYITGYIETDPVFSASAAAGISSTDITNWNSKVSDTGKWNDVSLNKIISDLSNQEAVIPFLWNSSDTVARFAKVSKVPSYNYIAQYNNGYLNSTTPDTSDSSTKVATTAWVTGKGYLTSYTETDPTVPSWAKAESKPSYTASEVGAVATSVVGAASGVAPLNASSKIDSTYLPSYVDDIIEGYYYNSKFWKEAAHTTEITGEAGKIYVDLTTDKTYRYSGTGYVEVSSGSLVTVTRNLTSGTKSATINIDGTDYDIYSTDDTKNTAGSTDDTTNSLYIIGATSQGANPQTYSNKNFHIRGSYLYLGYNGTTTATGLCFYYGSYYASMLYGGTVTGDTYTPILKFSSATPANGVVLRNIADPRIDEDAANKYYVDNAISSISYPVTSVNGQTGAVTLSISTVSITQNLTSGTKSATININGTDYDIYSETNTDTKVTQVPLNGMNSIKGLLFAPTADSVQRTDTVYSSNKISYNESSSTLYIQNSNGTKYGTYKFDSLFLANSNTSYGGRLKTAYVTADRTYTLPDATGTIALTSDIPSIPANVSAFTNDAGYITSSDIPVTSVNGQTGAVTITDQNVTQTAVQTDTSALYRLLLSNSTNDTTETNGVFKAGDLIYNPYASQLIFYSNSYTSTLRMYYNSSFYFNLIANGYRGNGSTYNAVVKFTSGSGQDVILSGISTPTSNSEAANKLYVDNAVTTQASISSDGLITYKNSGNTSLYTVQLPLFDGGTGSSSSLYLPLTGGSLSGNLSIGGTTTSTGLITGNGGISTTVLTTSSNATIGGNLNVSGTTTSTGLLTANGGISTTTLTTSGNTVVGGTLGVTGATTLGNALNVTGTTTLSSTLGVTGAATLSSTLDVTGAATLGSTLDVTGGGTFGGAIDVIPRRCYASLSSAGWYRVMQYTGSKTGAQWGTAVKIDFNITTAYSDTNNSLHAISMVGVYHYVDFVDEVSYSNTAVVDKIRYVYGADGNGYVDIHYSVNASNAVAVDFAVHYRHDAQGNFTSIPMTAVDDSPADETVMTEYEFITTTYGGMRYYRESISDITLSSAGFKTMTMPARIVGRKIVSIMISNCSTISGGAIIPLSYTDGSGIARSNYYMAGSPGASMTNAVIEFWYL